MLICSEKKTAIIEKGKDRTVAFELLSIVASIYKPFSVNALDKYFVFCPLPSVSMVEFLDPRKDTSY
jgi:hypothetical protein